MNSRRVCILSPKVALAILCSGRLEDKLTYIFSLISDSNGILIEYKFKIFLREVLSLASNGVFEPEFFKYDDSLSSKIFDWRSSSSRIKDFIEIFISPKGTPACLSFFMAFIRMGEVESVVHPVMCEGCHRNGFTGFRYKCQKCFNYNLCQDCFWRGRNSGSHDSDKHPCREYSFWQSQTREFSNSLRRSFRCLKPVASDSPRINLNEDVFDNNKKLDLKHIVPPSPILRHNTFSQNRVAPTSSFSRGAYAYSSLPRINPNGSLAVAIPTPPAPLALNPSSSSTIVNSSKPPKQPLPLDEEQQLIMQLSKTDDSDSGSGSEKMLEKLSLSASQADGGSSSSTLGSKSSLNRQRLLNTPSDDPKVIEKQKMIAELEARNREITSKIQKMKRENVSSSSINDKSKSHGSQSRSGHYMSPSMTLSTLGSHGPEPLYSSELTALRVRKEELESHLSALQNSRKDLLIQLESLMRLLKNHGNLLNSGPSSASSTLHRPLQTQHNYSTIKSTTSCPPDTTLSSAVASKFTIGLSTTASGHSISSADRHESMTHDKPPHVPKTSSSFSLQSSKTSTGGDPVSRAVKSVVRELHSEDESAIQELGLDLTQKLRAKEQQKDKIDMNKSKDQTSGNTHRKSSSHGSLASSHSTDRKKLDNHATTATITE